MAYLTNQQTLALQPAFLIWQQKARLALPPFYNPLYSLAAMDIMSNNKCFNPSFFTFLLLVFMYDDIAPSSLMQSMDCPGFIPIEMSCRARGR